MSRAKQVLRDTPLPVASAAGVPPLDPADLPHVPRWLDALREVERKANGRGKCPGCGFPAAGLPAGFHAMRCPTVAERGPR